MIDIFLMVWNFGEDRTTSAGCRCENVVFGCVFGHAPRSVALCVFEQALCHSLCVDFRSIFTFFS